ncbi:hypothetical protein N9L15_00710 [Euryarchaeota archaeon]|nr:hypothetical protein [Euryarchaeota archaeon]
MITKDTIQNWPVLAKVDDITITPKIHDKKARNAIRKYGSKELQSSDVILLIDNTILRSAKQGMFLTETHLYAKSAYSGNYKIALADIETIDPHVRHPIKPIPVFGFTINSEYFVSLPGLNQLIVEGEERKTGLEILVIVLAHLIDCKII